MVCTDSVPAYSSFLCKYEHQTVAHSTDEYVRRLVHTNGIESAWPFLKRSISGVLHHVSRKRLARHVYEIALRLNEGLCQQDLMDRMALFPKFSFGTR